MNSPDERGLSEDEHDSGDLNRETAEEHEEKGGRFARETGEESSTVESSEAGPGSGEIDEDLKERG
jgi:hypothetical protein